MRSIASRSVKKLLRTYFVGASLVMIAGVALGTEPSESQGPEMETTREALLESLLGDDPLAPEEAEAPESERIDAEGKSAKEATSSVAGGKSISEYAKTAARLEAQLETAEARLSAGKPGPAQVAQAEAIAATKRLIELAEQASTSPDSGTQDQGSDSSGPGSGGSGAGGEQSESTEAGDMTGARQQATAGSRNREEKSEESSDRPIQQRDTTEVISTFRSTVIEHAWGHLPERMRQRLRNGGSDKSLPRYETLVNRYFESLIRPEDR